MTDETSLPPYAPAGHVTGTPYRETSSGPARTSAPAPRDQFGEPLKILASVARSAPLASLLVAFLLGVATARRH